MPICPTCDYTAMSHELYCRRCGLRLAKPGDAEDSASTTGDCEIDTAESAGAPDQGTESPGNRSGRSAHDRLDKLDDAIDSRLERLEDRESGGSESGSLSKGGRGSRAIGEASSDANILGKVEMPTEAAPEKMTTAIPLSRLISEEMLPGEEEINACWAAVRDCKYIEKNDKYRQKAGITDFVYPPRDEAERKFTDLASACAAEVNGVPTIYLSEKYVMHVSVTTIWALAQMNIENAEWIESYGKALKTGDTSYEWMTTVEISAEDVVRLKEAFAKDGRELVRAGIISTLAHELGHVCYDHIYSPGYKNKPGEVNVNMERDADSFASSVIAWDSPDEKTALAGQILDWFICALIFCVQDKGKVSTTHPYPIERLQNTIRANPDAAAQLGINEEMVEDFFSDLLDRR